MKKYTFILVLFLPLLSFGQAGTKDSLNYMWSHIYKPEKLEIIDSLVTFTGTVQHLKEKSGSAYHILIEPDRKYKSMLNEENKNKQKGCLVVVPIYSSESDSMKPAEIAKKGDYVNKVKIPSKGDRVRVRGAFIKDKKKGWNGIMPVLTIQKIK